MEEEEQCEIQVINWILSSGLFLRKCFRFKVLSSTFHYSRSALQFVVLVLFGVLSPNLRYSA